MEAAVYLICEKKRGHQRKHIDVCRRCPTRKRCRAYRDHQQLALPLDAQERPRAPEPATRQAVDDAPGVPRTDTVTPAVPAPPSQPRRSQRKPAPAKTAAGPPLGELRTELQAIRDLLAGTPTPAKTTATDKHLSKPLSAADVPFLIDGLLQISRLCQVEHK